jgi:curved DNA-binding protein CbpA
MTDLYAVLGVPRDAPRRAIHAAYRRLSKRAHPDQGGSQEAFEAIKLARDVLTDPDRRARYDATGAYDHGMPDNTRANALGLVSRVMDAVMGDALNGRVDPTTIDFAEDVRLKLSHSTIQTGERLRHLARCEAAWREMLPRCGGRTDVMAQLIAGKLSSIEQARAAMEAELRITEMAIRLMADQTFRHDPPPPIHYPLSGFSVFTSRVA